MKNYFKATAIGNYSYSYGWDSGAVVTNVTAISLDEAKCLDYHGQAMGMFIEGKTVQTFDCHEYGGSRTINLVVCADNAAEAAALSQSYCDSIYSAIEYDGGGIRL